MAFLDQTKTEIEKILRKEFSPILLEVIDDSAAHRGHAEAMQHQSAGHFKVIMKSSKFNGLSPVKRHRLVYDQLLPLMEKKIHAISLNLLASDE